MFDFSIKIADKIFRFSSESPLLAYDAFEEREFKKFLCREDPDISFDIKYGHVPDFSGKETLFHVERSWSLSKYRDKVLFEYPDRSLEGRMERVGEIDKDITRGIIHVNGKGTSEEEEEAKKQREARRRLRTQAITSTRRCVTAS